MKIRITVGALSMEAELHGTDTGKRIYDSLPLKASFNTWGEEIYFPVPVKADLDETARDVVEIGDLGYWPPGNAFCIFFGQTPASSPGQIRPASAVNMIGKVAGDVARFKEVMDEHEVLVEAL